MSTPATGFVLVGVGITQAGQQFCLSGFHLMGVIIVLVVKTQQVQYAVDDNMCPVRIERLVLRNRFTGNHRGTNHDIAQQFGRPRRGCLHRETTAHWLARPCHGTGD